MSELMYIAGPISNTTDYHKRFMQGRDEVLLLGYIPVNPVEVCTDPIDWTTAMKVDIRVLLECDGLYALRNWEMSRGARIEHFLAHALGYTIIYQPEEANANRS